jgi:hypothetical protein
LSDEEAKLLELRRVREREAQVELQERIEELEVSGPLFRSLCPVFCR